MKIYIKPTSENNNPIFAARNILSINKLYHGGSEPVKNPDLRRCGNTKDFGWGFYCTNYQEQAEQWARRKGGVVSVYTWNPSVLNILKCLEFVDMATEEGQDAWVDFLSDNRLEKSGNQIHDFDIVAGPMGDDSFWAVAVSYMRNPTEDRRQRLINAAKFGKYTKQIVFCTDKALQSLKFLESYEV